MDISEHETGDYSAFVGSVFQDPRSQFFTLHVKTEFSLFSSLLIVQDDHSINWIRPDQYHPSILSKLFELEEF